jgi:hypothetical protein
MVSCPGCSTSRMQSKLQLVCYQCSRPFAYGGRQRNKTYQIFLFLLMLSISNRYFALSGTEQHHTIPNHSTTGHDYLLNFKHLLFQINQRVLALLSSLPHTTHRLLEQAILVTCHPRSNSTKTYGSSIYASSTPISKP